MQSTNRHIHDTTPYRRLNHYFAILIHGKSSLNHHNMTCGMLVELNRFYIKKDKLTIPSTLVHSHTGPFSMHRNITPICTRADSGKCYSYYNNQNEVPSEVRLLLDHKYQYTLSISLPDLTRLAVIIYSSSLYRSLPVPLTSCSTGTIFPEGARGGG